MKKILFASLLSLTLASCGSFGSRSVSSKECSGQGTQCTKSKETKADSQCPLHKDKNQDKKAEKGSCNQKDKKA